MAAVDWSVWDVGLPTDRAAHIHADRPDSVDDAYATAIFWEFGRPSVRAQGGSYGFQYTVQKGWRTRGVYI